MSEGISTYVSGPDSLQKITTCAALPMWLPVDHCSTRAAQRRNSWQDVISGHQWLPVAPLAKSWAMDQMVRRLVGN
jgi:hypothetical protein